MKVITTIEGIGDSRFKSWVRDLTGVDQMKTNGYAFLFENWYREGRKAEIEAGTLLLRYGKEGSRRYAEPVVDIVQVQEDGSFEVLLDAAGDDWALDLRDKAAALPGLASSARREQLEQEAETLRARLAEIEAELRGRPIRKMRFSEE